MFTSIQVISGEIWKNRARMMRVIGYDIKIENRGFYLGTLWKIITPLIQISVYWFVFGIGIRGGSPIDGYPFLIWMLAGLVPWFFMRSAISMGAKSILAKSGMLFKIKYPLATVPVGSVLMCMYDHVIMLGIATIVFAIYGIFPNLYWLNILYYIVFAGVFFASLAMILSVIVMLAQDFQNLINSMLLALFFLTPIVWQDNNLPAWVRFILSLNPILYVVNGFRDSIIYQVNFYEHPKRILFFWCVALILFSLGCTMQKKFSNRFIDWM
jgi:teichoic acid transport system permease protein